MKSYRVTNPEPPRPYCPIEQSLLAIHELTIDLSNGTILTHEGLDAIAEHAVVALEHLYKSRS